MTRVQLGARVMLPTLVVASLWLAPLISGSRTLYLRDVFATHLPLKSAQVEAWKEGEIPLVDTYRAGGQPGLGNPNSVPLYPTNLLYLVAPVLWALNAHFWIHWLLAGAALYWLARSWGFEREGAWASALAYACSGYFVSQLNLYNAVAGAALGPAFVAACLQGARRGWPGRRIAAAAGLAALLLLGGEPFLAAMAFVAAVAAVAMDGGLFARASRPWRWVAVFALAFAASSPLWVESWRVLADSWRWQTRFAPGGVAFGSFEWPQAVEWLVPFVFGRPDLFGADGFWGYAYHQMRPPLLFALAPGLGCLIALLAAGVPRTRASRWAWMLILAGGFLAWRPVAEALPRFFGDSLGLRYPIRFWWWVAVGASVLVGAGFQRWWKGEEEARRTARWAAFLFLIAGVCVWLWSPNERLSRSIGIVCLALVGLLLSSHLRLRRPIVALSLLSLVHVGSQLSLLGPALATDATGFYRSRPAVLSYLPEDARVVHAAFGRLGPWNVADAVFPDDSGFWLQRRGFLELYPGWGPLQRRRFELNPSPEGFDSAVSRRAQAWLAGASDSERLRLLRAWSIDRLLLTRPWSGGDGVAGAIELGRVESFGRELHVLAPLTTAARVRLARTTYAEVDFPRAVARLLEPDFDPELDLTIWGTGSTVVARPGRIHTVGESRERVEVEVDSPDPTYLALSRAWLPIYRASVDGEGAEVLQASLDRIAIAVPSGSHRVIVETDRRPTRASLAVALAALIVLGVLALQAPNRP